MFNFQELTCGPPENITNGHYTTYCDTYLCNTTYYCDPPYELEGN